MVKWLFSHSFAEVRLEYRYCIILVVNDEGSFCRGLHNMRIYNTMCSIISARKLSYGADQRKIKLPGSKTRYIRYARKYRQGCASMMFDEGCLC